MVKTTILDVWQGSECAYGKGKIDLMVYLMVQISLMVGFETSQVIGNFIEGGLGVAKLALGVWYK